MTATRNGAAKKRTPPPPKLDLPVPPPDLSVPPAPEEPKTLEEQVVALQHQIAVHETILRKFCIQQTMAQSLPQVQQQMQARLEEQTANGLEMFANGL